MGASPHSRPPGVESVNAERPAAPIPRAARSTRRHAPGENLTNLMPAPVASPQGREILQEKDDRGVRLRGTRCASDEGFEHRGHRGTECTERKAKSLFSVPLCLCGICAKPAFGNRSFRLRGKLCAKPGRRRGSTSFQGRWWGRPITTKADGVVANGSETPRQSADTGPVGTYNAYNEVRSMSSKRGPRHAGCGRGNGRPQLPGCRRVCGFRRGGFSSGGASPRPNRPGTTSEASRPARPGSTSPGPSSRQRRRRGRVRRVRPVRGGRRGRRGHDPDRHRAALGQRAPRLGPDLEHQRLRRDEGRTAGRLQARRQLRLPAAHRRSRRARTATSPSTRPASGSPSPARGTTRPATSTSSASTARRSRS